MKYRIENISGIIDDVPDYELPENVLSAGENIRFLDGKVLKIKGHTQVFGANPITPYYARPYNDQTTYYWIVPGENKIYLTDGTAWTNITRQNGGTDQNYAASLDTNWNGGILSGLPILNNGIDSPQSWSGQTSDRCVDLRYDDSNTWADKVYTAKCMRIFKSYIFAMDITKAGTRFENLFKWSSSSSAGSLPDWDVADATKDAGENAIKTETALIDGLPLRDTFIIYAEDSAYGVQHIGGRFVFRFYRMFSDGIVSRRCVKEVRGHHVALTANDVIIHDGQTPKSLLNRQRRRWLFNNIDADNYERSFIIPNYRNNELWICFPSTGQTLADTALIWNYEDNTFGHRELPSCPHIGYGVIDPGESKIIDDQTQIIDTDDSIIDARTYNPTVFYPLLLGTNLYQADDTEQFNGTNISSYAERTGLDFGSERTKRIKRIIPKMSGTGAVTFSLGSQKYPGDSVDWTNYTFTPGTDWKIDSRKTGKLFGYKIASTGNITWDLSSIDFEFEDAGDR